MSNFFSKHNHRQGLSLVEVLVAMTMTLIVLGVMARAFNFASIEMQKGRAGLEMTNRLRSVQTLFRKDLQRLTVETKPYFDLSEQPKGYFQLIEGPRTDFNAQIDVVATTTINENTLNNLAVGDYDDVWAGTIRTESRPFKGRLEQTDLTTTAIPPVIFNTTVQKSKFAEVVWFATFQDADANGVAEPIDGDSIRLYRRQLLIDPTNPLLAAEIPKINARIAATAPAQRLGLVNQFFQNNDFSVRVTRSLDGAGNPVVFTLTPNSLEDLAIRGNRFCHVNPTTPFTTLPNQDLPQNRTLNVPLLAQRLASNEEDLMLSGCLGFDLKVFSPDAKSLVQFTPVATSGTTAYQINDYAKPSDVGANILAQANIAGGAPMLVEDFFDGVVGNDATFLGSSPLAMAWTPLEGEYVDLGAGNGTVQTLTSPRAWSNPLTLGRLSATATVVASGGTNLARSPDPGVLGRQPFPFANPQFPLTGTAVFAAIPAYRERVYDTGTSWYNSNSYPLGSNGIDDDGDGLIDEGNTLALNSDTNGDGIINLTDIDLDGSGRVDIDEINNASGSTGSDGIIDNDTNFIERIVPPYNVRLRGIQASIRVLERNSGQIRQLTLRSSLSPQ